MLKVKKKIPFEFVLDLLEKVNPQVKPMFGCQAVYVKGKMVLVLRDKADHSYDNGVWIATVREHHESLKQLFPKMRSLKLFESKKPTGWQNLSSANADFESSVERVCELIINEYPRIGSASTKKKVAKKK